MKKIFGLIYLSMLTLCLFSVPVQSAEKETDNEMIKYALIRCLNPSIDKALAGGQEVVDYKHIHDV